MNNIYAKADHPITPLNPDVYFKIVYWKGSSNGKLYVRGENTKWFPSELCKFYDEKTALELIADENQLNSQNW